MAQTPYHDLRTEDILAAHISGIQHSINKIEQILNLKTASKTAQLLTPVTDQLDPSMHYRIYEGTDRNWLEAPAPVIKRNGTVVPSSEYIIQPAYGVVVFHVQQSPSDSITADYTYVINQSTKIESIDSSISSLQTNIGNLQTSINGVQSSVNNLQTSITNLQSTDTSYNNRITALENAQYFKDYFLSHKVGGYKSHGLGNGASSTDVQAIQNALDAYPFLVVDPSIVCDKMGVAVNTIASSGTHNTILGIYTDSNGFPGTLIASTGTVDCSTTGWKEAAFTGGDITLNRGLYWIARLSGGNTKFNGLSASHAYPVNLGMAPADSTYDQSTVGTGTHGVRYTYGSWPGSLPSTFPSIASGTKWLARTSYPSPWIRRKA